jgi:hypothetical protein
MVGQNIEPHATHFSALEVGTRHGQVSYAWHLGRRGVGSTGPQSAMAKRIAPCSWWRKSGYTQVIQLETDDGRWEGEGIKNARRWTFTPTALEASGEVTGRRNIIPAKPLTRWTTARRLTAPVADSQRLTPAVQKHALARIAKGGGPVPPARQRWTLEEASENPRRT